jgi:hypothetical protein
VLVGFESQSLSLHFNPLLAPVFYHHSPDSPSDSRFDAVPLTAYDSRRRQRDFWHRILVPSAIAYEIWYFTRVKPTKIKAFSTNPRDYPINMSLWEKESLAAEAVLAAERKAKKTLSKKQFAPKKNQRSA